MAICDTKTIALVDEYLTQSAGMENYEKTANVLFAALEIANGKTFKTEAEVELLVNEICLAKNWTATINWHDCFVQFKK